MAKYIDYDGDTDDPSKRGLTSDASEIAERIDWMWDWDSWPFSTDSGSVNIWCPKMKQKESTLIS